MKQFLYLIWWFFQVKFLGKRKPLQSVIFVNNKCNLNCRHCWVDKESAFNRSFEDIKSDLEYSYALGSRFVDFEGGEPTLWHDESGLKNINDLINLAKEIGFYTCTVTTNAKEPFEWIKADFIWVSLDGIEKYHDAIRGEGAFDKLVKNVELYGKSTGKRLSANMTINSVNEKSVEQTVKFIAGNKYLNSISLNFYIPFNGDNTLCVSDKEQIINEIIEMKKRGLPITNTFCGLKELKKAQNGNFCSVTNFITPDGFKHETCPGKELDMCEFCGYGMAAEMKCLYNFNPETILSGIKLRLFKEF